MPEIPRSAGRHLEIAMGLETVHPEVLPRLNKRMTTADFLQACRGFSGSTTLPYRAFILLRPPYLNETEGVYWAKRSIEFAFDAGAECCARLFPREPATVLWNCLRDKVFLRRRVSNRLRRSLNMGLGLAVGASWPTCGISNDFAAVARAGPAHPTAFAGDEYDSAFRAACGLPVQGNDMIREQADVAIVGAGFAGSLMALVLERIGRRTVLVERGTHPRRFNRRPSSTPLANLLPEQIAHRYELDWLAPLSKHGTWQQSYDQLPVGLKRGFSFFAHRGGHPFEPRMDHADQLLVAASPSDAAGDTHWFREQFDQFLVHKVQAARHSIF